MATTATPSGSAAAELPQRGRRFRYEDIELDDRGTVVTLRCSYTLDDLQFSEELELSSPDGARPPGAPAPGRQAPNAGSAGADPDTRRHALEGAALLVHLLSGVSYYKTLVPPVVDLGRHATTGAEQAFLRTFLLDGLGEMAYRNGLDLSDLEIVGPASTAERAGSAARAGSAERASTTGRAGSAERVAGHHLSPLIPFGGGIDSIVTVEAVRGRAPDAALFVTAPAGAPLAATDAVAAATGLPVVRVARRIDSQVRRSADNGFWNGHVPVTGILSAVAVLAAVAFGHDAVIMSNEHSASVPTLVLGDKPVNHQWSKGLDFENGFRSVLAARIGNEPEYFSFLRNRSELWVARQFAGMDRYHGIFRSCNRAFHIDPSSRAETWCGRCDKCCFIDLVLAPFLGPDSLSAVFSGREPLEDPTLAEQFRVLLGTSTEPRPFECVGDVAECRAALLAAADRPDRQGDRAIGALRAELDALDPSASPAHAGDLQALLRPLGPDNVPRAYAAADRLG